MYFAYNLVLPWKLQTLTFDVQVASKSKYPTEMLYFLTEHTLIMYVQINRFQ